MVVQLLICDYSDMVVHFDATCTLLYTTSIQFICHKVSTVGFIPRIFGVESHVWRYCRDACLVRRTSCMNTLTDIFRLHNQISQSAVNPCISMTVQELLASVT